MQQLQRAFAIAIETAGLEVRAIGRTLVPIDAEPAQALEDFLERLDGRPFGVGIVDAQDKGALVVPSKQVGE
jgi:hypothetical protein